MKSYNLVHQLIHLVEKMETENIDREISLLDFAGFLNSHLTEPPVNPPDSTAPFGTNERQALELASRLDNNIGRLITFISRYAKTYIKKVLEGTPLLAVEDFSCLGILSTHEHLSKSELIVLNVQEKTSGIQVITRLLNAELAVQWDDPDDKRGKRIAITEKGRKLLSVIFKDMADVSKIVTGTLTKPEKTTLLFLLQKLEHYHHELYDNRTVIRKEDLQEFAKTIT